MKSKRYTDEFKSEALKQILDRGYPQIAWEYHVTASLCAWIKKARANGRSKEAIDLEKVHLENIRLKAELKRVQEERVTLKKAAAYFARASE